MISTNINENVSNVLGGLQLQLIQLSTENAVLREEITKLKEQVPKDKDKDVAAKADVKS